MAELGRHCPATAETAFGPEHPVEVPREVGPVEVRRLPKEVAHGVEAAPVYGHDDSVFVVQPWGKVHSRVVAVDGVVDGEKKEAPARHGPVFD